ncbi:MAG: DNA topoisomerase IB, partial [Dehalococcoidia bacterium]
MGTARTPATSAPAGAPSRRSRLRHVSDEAPGYTRARHGTTGFAYLDPEGREVADEETLARIQALAIPPAWEDVWICASEAGHLQATGRDARGRKQYRYHPAWSASRDETKFGRMVAFGEALPRIRRRVEADLRRRGSAQEQGLPRERVVALVVRLLDTTGIRVGNVEYARDNDSYGLTTFRNKHAHVEPGGVVFTFRGKSGKQRAIDVRDPRLARIVQRCRDLPGYDLFQYVDEAGDRRTVGSGDVNDYIREAAGAEF